MDTPQAYLPHCRIIRSVFRLQALIGGAQPNQLDNLIHQKFHQSFLSDWNRHDSVTTIVGENLRSRGSVIDDAERN